MGLKPRYFDAVYPEPFETSTEFILSVAEGRACAATLAGKLRRRAQHIAFSDGFNSSMSVNISIIDKLRIATILESSKFLV
ncbi:MAG: hypothetical protein WBL95_00820 [Microcoleus sp.]